MLSTGIKTPVGIKFMGPDLQVLSDLAEGASILMRSVSGTTSAYAERTLGGYSLDIDPKPEQLARYGLNTADVQDIVQMAMCVMRAIFAATPTKASRCLCPLRPARTCR